MNRRSIIYATAFVLIVTALCLIAIRKPYDYQTQISFSGPSNSTNGNFILTVTNHTGFMMVYVPCQTEMLSNGVWTNFKSPTNSTMKQLAPNESSTVEVPRPHTGLPFRVPFLWGFQYIPEEPAWQRHKDDFLGRVSGRNPNGRGSLYTNYATIATP